MNAHMGHFRGVSGGGIEEGSGILKGKLFESSGALLRFLHDACQMHCEYEPDIMLEQKHFTCERLNLYIQIYHIIIVSPTWKLP